MSLFDERSVHQPQGALSSPSSEQNEGPLLTSLIPIYPSLGDRTWLNPSHLTIICYGVKRFAQVGTIHLFDPTDSLANDYLLPSVTVQNGLYGLVRISAVVGRATT